MLSWQKKVLFGENEAKRSVGFEVHRKGSYEALSLALSRKTRVGGMPPLMPIFFFFGHMAQHVGS